MDSLLEDWGFERVQQQNFVKNEAKKVVFGNCDA